MKKKYYVDWREALTPLFFLFLALSYLFQVRENISDLTYPLVVLVVSVTLLIIAVFKYVIKTRKHDSNEEQKEKININVKEVVKNFVLNKRTIFVAIIFFYFFLIEPLGFIIANGLLLLVMLWFLNKKLKLNHVLISVIGSVLIYLVFVLFMRYPLPTGIFGI